MLLRCISAESQSKKSYKVKNAATHTRKELTGKKRCWFMNIRKLLNLGTFYGNE